MKERQVIRTFAVMPQRVGYNTDWVMLCNPYFHNERIMLHRKQWLDEDTKWWELQEGYEIIIGVYKHKGKYRCEYGYMKEDGEQVDYKVD